MRRVNSVQLRNHLSEILNSARFGRQRIEVRRRGRLLGAIIPPRDWYWLQENIAVDEQQRAKRAVRDLKELGFNPPYDLYRITWGLTADMVHAHPQIDPNGAPQPPDAPAPWDGML